MKYLIVQDWPSTHCNHAGMVHMCSMLAERYPNDYKVLIKNCPLKVSPRKGLFGFYDKVLSHLHVKNRFNPIETYRNVTYPSEYLQLCKSMLKNIEEGDEIFLMEYLLLDVPQYQLAIYIRKRFPHIRIYALSHLTVTDLSKYDTKVIKEWSAPIDKMLTLGSSLSHYLESCGILKSKISTGFHYVDDAYYKRKTPITVNNKRIKIITMGAMKRNYTLLSDIVHCCPSVDWIICRGRHEEIDSLFRRCNNVSFKGYLAESELRDEMESADISINVMEDTIGSNVITTSMSMGLAMIVSDVGSIRDYCSEENTIFCKNSTDSFVNAVRLLCDNRELLTRMKINSNIISRKFTIDNIDKWFKSI